MGCDFENPIVGLEALLWIHVTFSMYVLGVWTFWNQNWWEKVHQQIDHLMIKSSYVVTALVLLSIGSGLAHANVWCDTNWDVRYSVNLWYLLMVGFTALFYTVLMVSKRPEPLALVSATGVAMSIFYGVYSFTTNGWATAIGVITGVLNLLNFCLSLLMMYNFHTQRKHVYTLL